MTDRRDHWERVYADKAETEVSWYQPHSERSLQSIRQASPDHSASVIDVGGGASRLAGRIPPAETVRPGAAGAGEPMPSSTPPGIAARTLTA